MPVTDLSGVR